MERFHSRAQLPARPATASLRCPTSASMTFSKALCHEKRRRSRIVAQSQAGQASSVLYKSLEVALQSINKIVQEAEQKRRKRVASGLKVEVDADKGKLVSFKASSSAEKLVKHPSSPLPGRTLREYLALPLDQYSLLDPRWITRCPDAADLFTLKVPLQDIIGLPLEPQIQVRVDIDTANNQVVFYADKFVLGDPRFDANFSVTMTSCLRYKPVPEVSARVVPDFWRVTGRAAQQQQQQQSGPTVTVAPEVGTNTFSAAAAEVPATAASTQGQGEAAEQVAVASVSSDQLQSPSTQPHPSRGQVLCVDAVISGRAPQVRALAPDLHELQADSSSGSSSGSGSSNSSKGVSLQGSGTGGGEPAGAVAGLLCCSVDVGFEVMMFTPLSAVPRPMLSLAGGLLTKFSMQQLLPGFLELLATDYSRWASGQRSKDKAVGSLLVNQSSATAAAGQQMQEVAAGLVGSGPGPEPDMGSAAVPVVVPVPGEAPAPGVHVRPEGGVTPPA